jgi:hypothetical protein
MRKKQVALLAIATPLFFAACDRGPTPVEPQSAAQAALPAPAQGNANGLEKRFAELEQAVPGFGGYFIENGKLTAYVTSPGRSAQARAALEPVLRELPANARQRVSEIQVRQGRYSFSQLARWRDKMPGVMGVRGVVLVDVDEAHNVIRVGVENAGLEQAVRAQSRKAGVPDEAVVVSVHEPIYQLATLRDHQRPVKGGLQIAFGAYVCTMGYVVNTARYITNSHCTNTQGGVESTAHYQPTTAYRIGTEIADPTYWTGGSCPVGRRCRYSDSSMGSFTAGVTFAKQVAQTAGGGSITISGLPFTVTGEQQYPTQGQELDKIGRTTGWSWGNVSSTCANINVSGTTITQLCQAVVGASVAGGDSGSPVFVWGGSTVTAAGLLWGGGSTTFVFSPVGNIESELGALTFN